MRWLLVHWPVLVAAISLVLAVGVGIRVIWIAILEERVAQRLEEIHREMEL